jgi:4'-phosphopantetheinyl transferase
MAVREQAWDFPPTHLEAGRDAVHVWRASLDPPSCHVQRLERALSEEEHARAGQFCFERDRMRFVVGRGLLRAILGRYLDIPPARLELRCGGAGKPAVCAAQRRGIEFSVSHSCGLVLYAVTSDRRVGIDIERVRVVPELDHVARRILSRRERAVFQAIPPKRRQAAFFSAWTRKEAYLKACGVGLSPAVDRIDVSLVPFESERRLRIEGDPEAGSHWSLQPLFAAPGYVAALATEGGETPRITQSQWPEWL